MNMKLSIREAYERQKAAVSFAKEKAIREKLGTFGALLEDTDKIKELAESIERLEAMAKISQPKFPAFAKVVTESVDSLITSATNAKGSNLFQESLYRLAALTELLAQLPAISDGTPNSLQESIKSSGAAFLLENDEFLKDIFEELSKANRKQLQLMAEHAPKIQYIVSESMVRNLANSKTPLAEGYVLTEADLKSLTTSLDNLTKIVSRLGPEFKETQAGLQKFKARFRNAAAGGFSGLTVDNQKRLLAQVDMVLQMFAKLGSSWPNIKSLFGDELSDVKDVQQYSKIVKQFQATIKKELGGGIMAGLGRLFGKNSVIYPAEINPDIVIRDMMEVLNAPAAGTKELGPQMARTARSGALAEGLISPRALMALYEDLAKLDSIMGSLAASAPTPPKPEETVKLAKALEPAATDVGSDVGITTSKAGEPTGSSTSTEPSKDSNPIVAAIENVKNSSIDPAKKKELIAKAVEQALSGDVKAAFDSLTKELEKATPAAPGAGPTSTANVAAPSTPSTAPASAVTTAPTKPTKAPRKKPAAKPAAV